MCTKMHSDVTDHLRSIIEAAMKTADVGARRFEEMHGLKPWALRGLLDPDRRQSPSIEKAKEICDALGLEFYIGPPRLAPDAGAVPQFAPVPVLNAELAAGDGAANGDEPVIAHLAFRRDWLRRIGLSPQAAVIARARGRSMEPTIHDGDMVLIDRGASTLPARPRDASDQRPARIYALRDDGGARVKRLDLAAPGVLALMSDNPDHPPEFRPVSEVQVIGRVVWWGHTDRG